MGATTTHEEGIAKEIADLSAKLREAERQALEYEAVFNKVQECATYLKSVSKYYVPPLGPGLWCILLPGWAEDRRETAERLRERLKKLEEPNPSAA